MKPLDIWAGLDPRFNMSWLGFLPDILTNEDPRSVKEQLEDRYAHGGGWRSIPGMKFNPKTWVMRFPGDSPFKPAAFTKIGSEMVIFYPNCSLLAIVQPDGTYEVTRVD